MAYGIQVINERGKVVIDGEGQHFKWVSKGTAYPTTAASYYQVATHYGVVISHAADEFVGIRPSAAWCWVDQMGLTSSRITSYSSGVAVPYCIFKKATMTNSASYGMTLFNSAGTCIFDTASTTATPVTYYKYNNIASLGDTGIAVPTETYAIQSFGLALWNTSLWNPTNTVTTARILYSGGALYHRVDTAGPAYGSFLTVTYLTTFV